MASHTNFHGHADDGFGVVTRRRPVNFAGNPEPYWVVELHQSDRCWLCSTLDGSPPPRHDRIELTLHLDADHMRALRDALSAALQTGGVEQPAPDGREAAFDLGVRAVAVVAEARGLPLDLAEFVYADELAREERRQAEQVKYVAESLALAE